MDGIHLRIGKTLGLFNFVFNSATDFLNDVEHYSSHLEGLNRITSHAIQCLQHHLFMHQYGRTRDPFQQFLVPKEQ